MYIDDEGKLTVFTLSPQVERLLMDSMQSTTHGMVVNLAPDATGKILRSVSALVDQMTTADHQPVALTSANVRLGFRTCESATRTGVVSNNEIAAGNRVFQWEW